MLHEENITMVSVDTHLYENSYAKMPRGYGYWFFRIGSQEISYTGLYSECKKKAIKRGNKTPNVTRIYLLP